MICTISLGLYVGYFFFVELKVCSEPTFAVQNKSELFFGRQVCLSRLKNAILAIFNKESSRLRNRNYQPHSWRRKSNTRDARGDILGTVEL